MKAVGHTSDDTTALLETLKANEATSLIAFNSIDFSYHSRSPKFVLRDLSISIASNKITCFIGKSGCGKSTISALITGLYRPKKGNILYDFRSVGGPLRVTGCNDVEKSDHLNFLSRYIGVVEQSSNTLLSGTIADNIAYGKVFYFTSYIH